MSDIQRVMYLLIAGLAVGAIALIVMFIYLVQITGAIKQQSEDNYEALSVQIPALRQQITNREKTIAKLEAEIATDDYVFNEQAVPAVIYLVKQVEALGGKPPQVLLNAEEPPFSPN